MLLRNIAILLHHRSTLHDDMQQFVSTQSQAAAKRDKHVHVCLSTAHALLAQLQHIYRQRGVAAPLDINIEGVPVVDQVTHLHSCVPLVAHH